MRGWIVAAANGSWIVPIATTAVALAHQDDPLVVGGVGGGGVAVAMALAVVALAVSRRHGHQMVVAPAVIGLSIAFLALFLGGSVLIYRTKVATEAGRRSAQAGGSGTSGAIEDPDYRFRLAWPGRPWRMLNEQDAQHFVPGAVAGMLRSDPPIYGLVVVEDVGGMTLNRYRDSVIGGIPEPTYHVRSQQTTRFGEPAWEVMMEARTQDSWFRFLHVIFLHQGHGYRLVAWGSTDDARVDGSTFAPFLDAFSLLPGEVTTRGAPEEDAPLEETGPGWRVRRGVFEDGVYGFTLAPPPGWRLLIRGALDELDEDGQVGLSYGRSSLGLVVSGELGEQTRAEREARLARDLEHEPRVPFDGPKEEMFEVGGRTVRFHRHKLEEDVAHEVLTGITEVDGGFLYMRAWHYPEMRDEARTALAAALASIRPLDVEAKATLRAQLLATEDAQLFIREGDVFRQGIYRNFEHGVTWTKPRGFWLVRAGDRNVVELEERALGVYAQIEITQRRGEDTLDEEHRSVTQYLRCSKPAACPVSAHSIAGREALTSEGTTGPGWSLRHTTIELGEHFVHVDVRAATKTLDRERRAVEAVERGLAFPGPELTALRVRDGVARDERLGFELDLTWSGISLTSETPQALASSGVVVSGAKGELGVALLAMVRDDTGSTAASDKWFSARLEHEMRRRLGSEKAPEVTRGEGLLGGVPANHATWEKRGTVTRMHFVVRNRIHYGFITTHSRYKANDGERLAQSFRFLD